MSLVLVSIERINQKRKTVFDHISKHLKNTPLRVVFFNSHLGDDDDDDDDDDEDDNDDDMVVW